jgi:3D (Asp-Asp-Asp) domain-containing protein
MHHDTFAWVRLTLLIILILSFALFCSCAETRYKTEQPEPEEPVRKEPIHIAQVETPKLSPLKAEAATEPKISKPTEETTPATEPATIATEPPTEPRETEPPTETAPPETEPPIATEPTVEPTEATEPEEEWRSLGKYTLTAYCSCQKCCGQYALNRPLDENGNPIVYTSIGAVAQAGVTIAVDPRVIPYGSEVKINDHIYIAQDTGGNIKGARIDVYFDDHQEALQFGLQTAEVFIRS